MSRSLRLYIAALFVSIILTSKFATASISNLYIKLDSIQYKKLFQFDSKNREKVKVSVSIDNVNFEEASLNFKGHTTMLFPKRGLSLKFKSEVMKSRFNNMSEISFNPMYTDKSFIRESLAWSLFKELGGVGPSTYGYFRVYFNETYMGLYLAIQPINKEFLKSKNLSTELLFEAKHDVHMADLKTIRDDYAKDTYVKKDDGDIGYSKLFKMIKKLNATDAGPFSSLVKELFIIESIYNWFVLNTLTMQGDTYVKNYFLHLEPEKTPGWTIFPWDYDLSFGRDGNPTKSYPLQILNDLYSYSYPVLNGPPNLIKDNLLVDKELLPDFKSKLKAALNGPFNEERLIKKIDYLAKEIAPIISSEPNSWSNVNDFGKQIEALKYYVTQRSNYIDSQFLNPSPVTVYDQAEILITPNKKRFSFVDSTGRTLAFIRFSSFKKLKSLTLKIQPSKDIPQFRGQNHIKRLIEIIPDPKDAIFDAELVWEYLDSPLICEVAAGLEKDSELQPVVLVSEKVKSLKGEINSFANLVFTSISQKDVGAGKYISAQEVKTPKWQALSGETWLSFNKGITERDDVLIAADDGVIYTLDELKLKAIKLPFRSKITNLIKLSDGYLATDYLGYSIRISSNLKSWSYSLVPVGTSLSHVILASENILLATGENGTIYASTDNGVSFTSLDFKNGRNIFSLIKTASQILMSTSDGIFESSDMGRSWLPLRPAKDKLFSTQLSKYKSNLILGSDRNTNRLFTAESKFLKLKFYKSPSNSKITNIDYSEKMDLVFVSTEDGEIYSTKDLQNWNLEHKSNKVINSFVINDSTKSVYALSRFGTLFFKSY